jgi:hypothetical protein
MSELRSLHAGNPLLEELKAEGRVEGRVEGEAQGLQKALITTVELRFPRLKELAEQKGPQVTKPDKLDLLLRGIYTAPDENAARLLLNLAA